MSFKVDTIASFRREAKKLIKKYPSLKNELVNLVNQLSINPNTGTPFGNNCYKIRLAIASKGKGKSGGARVLHTSMLLMIRCFCFQCMTSPIRRTFLTAR